MMKKLLSLFVVLMSTMAINAQVVKSLDEVANYIDFQQAGITSTTIVPTSVESTWFHFDNGTVVKGYLKSDGTEAANYWVVKDSYNTTCPTPKWIGVDSLTVGTMFRGASGSSIVLGAFSTTADGKLRVYFQPNGDSDRGVSITVFKGTPVECSKSGVKINGIRPIYAAEVELEADDYAAGDVVIKIISNTTNVFGVEIENLAGVVKTHTVTTIADPNMGSIQGDTTVKNSTTTDLIATPNTGYHFTQWSDGNTDNPRTVVVTSDTTFTAEFAKNQYIISTSVQSGNGTTYGDSIAEYQDQVLISAVADYGWQFSRWSDGNGSNPRTVVATEDKEYKAIFVRKNFYVSVLSANTTMGYVNGSGSYEYESNATISATGRMGYEFNEWSDGNAENPRTFVVTGDTTFTATFRMQTHGECGNDLRWEYRNNVLYISGTGAMTNYSTSTQPWYLYRDSIQTLVLNAGITSIGNYAFYGLSKITKLTLPEGLTTIGAYAFSGCNHITEIIFSSTISSIGDYAFNNCTRVLDMTNYATVTPDVATNALTSISNYAYLYVQAGCKRVYQIDSNWSRFDLREIGAETVTTPVEDVVVEPSENEAEFTWPTSTEAASYSLTITKDGIVFCTLTFNANGQLTGLAFAPGRKDAEHAPAATTSVAGMTFTVTGLDAATAYAFSFDAKDASQQVIESYTGTFETAGYQAPETPTELEHVDGVNKYVNTPTKVIRDGQVLIQRGDRLYDLRGQEVK